MKWVDQADRKGYRNAEAADNHSSAGIIQRGQWVYHRIPTPARTIAQIEAALWVSITMRRFT